MKSVRISLFSYNFSIVVQYGVLWNSTDIELLDLLSVHCIFYELLSYLYYGNAYERHNIYLVILNLIRKIDSLEVSVIMSWFVIVFLKRQLLGSKKRANRSIIH